GQGRCSVGESCVHSSQVQIGGVLLGGELLADGLFDFRHLDAKQLGHDADINHVAHEFAQLGLGTDRGYQLVVRHRVEDQIIADLIEGEGLVVNDDGARVQ